MTVPDDSAKERILAALRAYNGGKIYLMGPLELVTAGFDLYNEREVAAIEWAKNFSCLHVRIGRAGRVVMNVRLKEDQPAFSCTCSRGSRGMGCEHAVCAVLMLKNLLIPDVFKPKKLNRAYRNALLAGLIGASPEAFKKADASGCSIVLEQQARGGLDVFVARNGERITKLAELLQTPLAAFSAPDLYVHQKLDALPRFLKQHGNKYPITVRIAGSDAETGFDPALFPEAFTELALNGEEVSVIKDLRDQDLRKMQFVLFDELAFFPELGKLAVVENTRGWEAWRAFDREMKTAGHDAEKAEWAVRFSIPLAQFETMQHACMAGVSARGNKDVLFTLNKKKARPVPVALEPRMTIILPEMTA